MQGHSDGSGSAGSRHSRREFIKRVIASGVVASSGGFVLSGCTPGRRTVAGSVERLVSLDINGQVRRVDVLPQETLAMTLRYKLGLTGTKLSCDRAECGACTVMIDGVTHYSCSTLTHSVRNRKVVTVEGLRGPDGELHPVQQAFVDQDALQCGFCTPGQIMSAVAAVQQGVADVREFMSGNLCRCAAYPNIVAAVEQAAERMGRSDASV